MDLLGQRPPVRRATADVRVVAVGADREQHHVRPDRVATEEPMSIRIGGPGQDARPVSVTMRTPGHDFELAVGFCWSEAILTDPAQIRAVKYCELDEEREQRYNIVTIRTDRPTEVTARAFTTTSSCGVCGSASIDELQRCVVPIAEEAGPRLDVATLVGLPDALRAQQKVFATTGGLHAAALADAAGSLTCLREDVGRHNAVDKVIGRQVLDRKLPLRDHVLVVSGRTSFEIVQKAAMAQIAMVVAVSAPTSLAVDTADRLGITLVGFVRDGTANVYTHHRRVV
jgi:FdhD protein